MHFILNIVLALILVSNFVCLDGKCTEPKQQDTAQPDAGLILIPSATGTYYAKQKPRNPDHPYIDQSSRIIKIGSTYTKGRDKAEMQKLLTGPAGSKIDVTVLGPYGELSVVALECKTEAAAQANVYKNNYRANYFERGEKDSLFPNTQSLLSDRSLLVDGAVLQIAGAFTSYIQEYPLAYQQPEQVALAERLPSTAEFFTTSGMFGRLDEVAKYGLKLLSDPKNKFNRAQLQAITMASVILSEYSNSEAVKAFKEEAVKRLSVSSLPKRLNPDWSLRITPEAMSGAYKTPYDLTAEKLADAYAKATKLANNEDYPGAKSLLISTVNNILSTANPQTIVTIERGNTPCVSDLELMLARLEYQTEEMKEAKIHIDRAVQRIENALGSDTPYLSEPLLWSRRIEKTLGNADISSKITSRVSEINPVAESSHLAVETIDQLETPGANRAYNLIQDGKLIEAKEVVDGLLSREKGRETHDPLSVARLISVANVYSKTGHVKEAREILVALSPMLTDEKAMMLRVYQLAEIAVLPYAGATDPHAPWRELEQTLAEVLEPGSTKFEAGYPENTEVKRQDRLRMLAIAYCLNNEPEKAVKLMRHGLKEHHVERYPEPIAQMDFAYCLLKTGDFEGAQKAIEAAFKNAESLDQMPFYESLSRVAQYYRLLGKTKESEALFLRAVDADKNSKHCHGYAYILVRLADLQASLGRYDEAEKNYKLADSKPEGTRVFPDWQARLANAIRLKNGESAIPLDAVQKPGRRQHVAINTEPEPPADNDNTPWAIRQRLMNAGKYKELAAVLMKAMKEPDAVKQLRNMDHPGNILHDVYYDTLMKGEVYQDVEDLLKQAIKVRTVLSPQPGDHAILYKGLLLKFYATRKDNSKANALKDELLTDLDSKAEMTRASAIQSYYPFHFTDAAAEEWIKNGQYSDAEKLLDQTLALQKKWLGSENEQQVETLTVMSKLYEKTGRSVQAEGALKRAFDIVCWLRGAESRYSTMIRNDYAGILRKNGKLAEAELISSYRASDEQQPALDWDTGNGNMFQTDHSPPPKYFKDSAEKQLERWLARTKRINGHIGQDTLQTLDYLVRFYKNRQRWDEVQRYLLEKLDVWNKVEGRCSVNRTQVMLRIVRNQIDRGDRKSAAEWLAKAINEESSVKSDWNTPKLLVSYALLHIELNQMPKADHEAFTALNMLENRGSFPNVSDVDLVEDIASIFQATKNAEYSRRVTPVLEKCKPLKNTRWYIQSHH